MALYVYYDTSDLPRPPKGKRIWVFEVVGYRGLILSPLLGWGAAKKWLRTKLVSAMITGDVKVKIREVVIS